MKGSPIIAIVLSLAVVLGQVQYTSMYCSMMKHSIDRSMQMRCFSHSRMTPVSPGDQRVGSPLHTMLRVISKGTTDCGEQHRQSDAPTTFMTAIVAMKTDLEPMHSLFAVHAENKLPPPDIVIRNLNLRI